MNNYLNNPICKFEPLFNLDINKKKDIISLSLFKMDYSYRDINIYVDYLKITYDKLKENFPNFTIRIFIDYKIYEDKIIMNKLLLFKDIEYVLFKCSKFIINDYHIGLFSTLIRFFPMFDFKNNDAKIVLISDIDGSITLNMKNILNYMINNDTLKDMYFFKEGPLINNREYFYNLYIKNKESYIGYSNAQLIGSYKRMNKEVILNYLNKLLLNNDNLTYSYFKNNYNINHKKFIYGVDEYFCNKTLIDYLNDNKIQYCVNLYLYIYSPLKKYVTSIYDRYKNDKYFIIIIKKILFHLNIDYNYNISILENYNIINDILLDDKSNKKNKLLFIIYKIIIKIYNNKNYKNIISKTFYKFIFDIDLLGIYELNQIKYYHYDYKNFINYNKMSNKKLKYIKKYIKKYVNNK